jgi:C4-dicarboxylate-specific signal transduction histidine kinase
MVHDSRGALQILTLLSHSGAPRSAADEASVQGHAAGAVDHLAAAVERFGTVFATPPRDLEPVIAEDVLAEVAELQRFQKALPAMHVEVRSAGGLPPVRAVETDLRHALLSLIKNAKEAAAPAGGRLVLGARAHGEGVEILVQDDGPGFPAGLAERAFEPFVSTREGHLGIGLTAVRLLVERWGGRVRLGPEGSGAEVAIQLVRWKR